MVIKMKKNSLTICMILLIIMFSSSCKKETIRMITGSSAAAGEKGFYLFDINLNEENLKLVLESEATPSPPYFCISGKKGLIYAVKGVKKPNGEQGGAVTTLKYDVKNGRIEKVSELDVSYEGLCFISLSKAEDFLFTADYSGGSVAVIKLDDKGIPISITDTVIYKGDEGKVSHAHMISPDPEGKRVYVTDLGLDRIVIYTLDPASGKLLQISNGIVNLPVGSGPRHFAFSSDVTKMYVINELNSTISVFNVDADGELKSIQTVTTLREGFKGESYCADIHIGSNGHFLYGSNRGENSIVTFKIGSDGLLTLAGHTSCRGDCPRNFVIDPSGKCILIGNEKSNNISFFRINEKTGIPVEPGEDYKITAPVCLKFIN
jgi:6-phosphogluconolactonase